MHAPFGVVWWLISALLSLPLRSERSADVHAYSLKSPAVSSFWSCSRARRVGIISCPRRAEITVTGRVTAVRRLPDVDGTDRPSADYQTLDHYTALALFDISLGDAPQRRVGVARLYNPLVPWVLFVAVPGGLA